MSRAASPTAIGAFVVGAVILAAVAIVYFGSAKLGGPRLKFVCLFDESVEGLQVGSKVTFKGVPIGEVTKILIRFEDHREADAEDGSESRPTAGSLTSRLSASPIIPVVFEIDQSRVQSQFGLEIRDRQLSVHHENVEAGLRAKLKTSSLITGLLILDLDFYPNAALPADYAPTFDYDGVEHYIIPAEKSDLVALKEQFYTAIDRLSEVEFDQMGAKLNQLLETVESKIDAVDVENLNATIAEIRSAIERIDVKGPLESIEEAGAKIAEAAESLRAQLEAAELANVSTGLQETLKSTSSAMDNVASTLSDQSQTKEELNRALGKIADAAGEVEELAAFLSDQPSSIIWGRKDKPPRRAPGEAVDGSDEGGTADERPRVLSSRERFASPVRSRR